MFINLTNFDEKPAELKSRGKFLDSNGKVSLNGQPVAGFGGRIWEPAAGRANLRLPVK